MSKWLGNTGPSIREPTLQGKRAARNECPCMKGGSVMFPCHSACLEKLQGNIMIIKSLLKLHWVDLPPQWDKYTYSAGRIGQPSLSDMLMKIKRWICERHVFNHYGHTSGRPQEALSKINNVKQYTFPSATYLPSSVYSKGPWHSALASSCPFSVTCSYPNPPPSMGT